MDETTNKPGQPKQATPQQQKMFDTLARQALEMLLSEQASDMILAGVKAKGPVPAISDAVIQVMKGAIQAAQAAGLQISDDIINAAAKPGVTLLVQGLAQSGFIKDDRALVDQIMQAVDEGVEGDDSAAEEGAEEESETPEQEQAETPEEQAQEPVEY